MSLDEKTAPETGVNLAMGDFRAVAHWIGIIEDAVYNDKPIDRDVLARLVAFRHSIVDNDEKSAAPATKIPSNDLVAQNTGEEKANAVVVARGNGKAADAQFITDVVEFYNWLREFGESRYFVRPLRERLGYIITKYHAKDLHRKSDGGLEYEP